MNERIFDEHHKPIEIRGARVHNLKNVNLDIPRNCLTVISGPTPAGSPIVIPKILRMAASFSKGRCHGRFAVPCAGRPIPPGTSC